MFSDEATFRLIEVNVARRKTDVTVHIPRSSEEQDALMRYRHGRCLKEDVQIVMDAVSYVANVLLPKTQYTDDVREDFGQELLCRLLNLPGDTLWANLEARGFNAVMFYQGRTVKSELLRKAPVVALPRRRKKVEVSRNAQLPATRESIGDAVHAFQKERWRSHLRLVQSKADIEIATAMSLMMEKGYEPGEAASSVGLSRPTFLRRLKALDVGLAA